MQSSYIVPTLKDRTVQMLLKMVLEPIYESDFLNCSNGFRPQRRTQDCIALMDSYINRRNKYYWVIEGDIKGAFDSIHHRILLDLMAKRIGDKHLLRLVERFLKAGIMSGQLFKRTDLGIPQGGICSPLLANIYLHQLDLYWWNKYGNLNRKEKERRRTSKQGNCALIRYADDWLILTNGGKAEALRLKEEFGTFLKEELKLELNSEKTHVTHVNQGFNFLGFHIQRYVSGHDRPKMLVTPAPENVKKLMLKIKQMTKRKYFQDSPLLKFSALNAVLRGWINYYRHSNAKKIARDLDFWVNQRLFKWLVKRHKSTARRIMKMYKMREKGRRNNLGIRNGEKLLFLYRMSDLSLTKYRSRKPENPYLQGEWLTGVIPLEIPIPSQVWKGQAQNSGWRELKEIIKAERGAKCSECGCTENLDLHHIIPRKLRGKSEPENLQLLCRKCHALTSSFGRRKQQ
ncbi:MAG: Group II intron-encoded protein LtrA [Chroococcopsis gigantea SAG 12.99]|nr:Group II intron-encoded protein LtrA [Chroococcopsis gigantea SAG 12.99]MDV3000024.1 Group II intron-encoded protein LtrA [Chroococcopsis gigantea SAG 12.99]MDV3001407.1 Group II intron-encoded protein LtrA [Chroococcopsis gigantea SAG 12.99]MDV3002033.1 Group II intron-encoded protein LtrA [Chroococcopsis gigantea SAG 12.99]